MALSAKLTVLCNRNMSETSNNSDVDPALRTSTYSPLNKMEEVRSIENRNRWVCTIFYHHSGSWQNRWSGEYDQVGCTAKFTELRKKMHFHWVLEVINFPWDSMSFSEVVKISAKHVIIFQSPLLENWNFLTLENIFFN